ncbi:MAG: FAD-dependent oxidoreductase [Microbacteriaceae bacterium]|jgi:NADPH-dependent 2,4-dienoyl-CoA reductase/sulfur reductase-like enzyme/rhodanese-related sulfurtransferase|nr:FAD-dependent oxidoreductase [Microbacteriaceae bacterium]
MSSAATLPHTVVIIGGVAGGMSAATRLRRIHETAEIIVIERGGAVSFANCGLPYHVGGVIPHRGSLVLQQPEQLKKRFNIDVHLRTEATAINRDDKTVSVTNLVTGDTRDISYDALVLSPGSTPFRPPIPGVEDAHVLWNLDDMDRLMAAAETAKSAIVVGGGFIGLELAENLVHRGISTTLVEALPQLMPTLDVEMAWPLVERARFRGLDVRLSAQVQAITDSGVTLADGSMIEADMTVVAVGARPNIELAVEAGLEMGEAGGVVVDDQQRTSDPSIWAVGDVAQKKRPDGYSLVPLAGLANRHGRLAADSIAGRTAKAVPAFGTSIVGFFGMAAASTGYTERVLTSKGHAMRIIHSHPINHAGYYPDAVQMAMKLIVDPETDLILGAQAVGEEGVDKRIDVIATAMAAGLTATDLMDLELSYAPQFASAKDPVNMLGYVNENRATGEKAVQWHEVDALLAEGWTLIDVRTEGEYSRGAIPGSTLITLDELRDHVESLRDHRVIVTCRVGQRGHTAASILTQSGIEVANLDGGYLTWQMGTAATTHPEVLTTA